MATQTLVGKWVRRRGRYTSKWHLVESIIIGAALTKCGRYMSDLTFADRNPLDSLDPLQTGEPVNPVLKCLKCFPDARS